ATSHCVSNMLFLIDGAHAEGELLTSAYHRALGGTQEMIAYGRYLDRYEKRDDVWKFLRRSLVLDWVSDRPLAAAIQTVGASMGIAVGSASAEDPCFERLSLFHAQRAHRP